MSNPCPNCDARLTEATGVCIHCGYKVVRAKKQTLTKRVPANDKRIRNGKLLVALVIAFIVVGNLVPLVLGFGGGFVHSVEAAILLFPLILISHPMVVFIFLLVNIFLCINLWQGSETTRIVYVTLSLILVCYFVLLAGLRPLGFGSSFFFLAMALPALMCAALLLFSDSVGEFLSNQSRRNSN